MGDKREWADKPGKTPGTAEGGAFDNGPMNDPIGKTPGSAEGPPEKKKGYVEGASKLDRKKGDPPA